MKLKKTYQAMVLAGLSFTPLHHFNIPDMEQTANVMASDQFVNGNPLLHKWSGPYGGVPAFDKIKVEHFAPALRKAITDRLAAIQLIADSSTPATFDNTIVALERTRTIMSPVQAVFNIWSVSLSTPEFQAVERTMATELAIVEDKIVQNTALFARINEVYHSPEKDKLTPEQQRLVWLYYTNFVRAGAKLDNQSKSRLTAINQKLATLFTGFQQNVLRDEMDYFVVIDNEKDLAGLTAAQTDAAAREAQNKKLPGKWIITNTRSSVDPFLTNAENRELRKKVWQMFVSRGDNGGETDNNKIVNEILQLRLERAKLLGYETHAHWRLENTMAKTPEGALDLLEKVWAPSIKRVSEEVADMQKLATNDHVTIEPWDYHFYMEKVRKQRFNLDQNEVKAYLQLDKLREGMFYVAEELFDLSFVPAKNVPVYHADVTVWEVKNKISGKHVGLFYFDPYARAGKKSGAWMNSYRTQQKLDKEIAPLISNNSNFVKSKPGQPVLISWDDATTLFHEFGHGLHGLLSDVNYPSLAGTNVVRDFVEFPSQLLEHWLSTPEILKRFAVHYQTGAAMPDELIEKLKQSATFKQGYATTEYLASALIDMELHLLPSLDNFDAKSFEQETLASLKMPKSLVMRHRIPQFLHIFSGDSYSAGYYSYLWADVLTADGFEAFLEGKGPFDKAVAQKLYKHVLSSGNTNDPAETYRAFRSKDPVIEGLMKKRGFN